MKVCTLIFRLNIHYISVQIGITQNHIHAVGDKLLGISEGCGSRISISLKPHHFKHQY